MSEVTDSADRKGNAAAESAAALEHPASPARRGLLKTTGLSALGAMIGMAIPVSYTHLTLPTKA